MVGNMDGQGPSQNKSIIYGTMERILDFGLGAL